METMTEELTLKRIFIFWLPLAATWLMMSVEGPLLAAIIARLADPKFNLAAYGVAFSFAMLVEAPVIMLVSASTALVKERDSFRKLRNFTRALNTLVTLVMLLVIFPPVFYWLAEDLIHLPDPVARLSHTALMLLLPWPAAIGIRRFYQGILIRHNLTRRVAYGTIIRLTSMAGVASGLYFFSRMEGAVIGAAALAAGVCMEAVASRLMVHSTIKPWISRQSPPEAPNNAPSLSYPYIVRFYYPLALTSLIALGVHPVVTFFMGQSRQAIESLAVLPVIGALVFIFRSLGLSFMEVVITFSGENSEGFRQLHKFALLLGGAVVSILGLIAFSPLAEVWFCSISGLSPQLSDFARLPTQILAAIPGTTVLLSLQRGTLVNARHTAPITRATAVEFLGTVIVLVITIKNLDFVGAVAATTAMLVGRLGANMYLMPPFLKALGRGGVMRKT